MALRDQPYLPLYVNDFLVDEKLRMCSAESTGVYIRLMCLMHKSEEYGTIKLSTRDKKSNNQIHNFALILLFQLPYDLDTIERSLNELIDRAVLTLDDDRLVQKRMLKDGKLSLTRSLSGSRGGRPKANQNQNEKQNQSKQQSKSKANTENEDEDIVSSSSNKSTGDTGVQGEKNQREELSRVMTLYLDRINPSPSGFCIDLLESYTDDMGADVVCRAINMAIDNKATSWNYIKAILQRWSKEKVRSIEDVDKLEEKAGKWKERETEAEQQGSYHYDPGSMEGSL